MTNKNYVDGLIELFNSFQENFTDFTELEEPVKEIEKAKCNIETIQKELLKLGYKTEIKTSKKLKEPALFISKNA